ncbi:outer membrane beta-barrel protein [Pseudofulvibacter geojedonensis]|uniref:Outer membrane beta-barrel protein n=1 Tax=Pseudofulvibacter geojedonensis TaxID=1123758 RepID=A0ABW3I001_9FLAO
MGERKNIDQLFQEQLKNFEEAPGDHVWENIREELEKTKEPKKRVLPIWYRFTGVAASLILLISLVVNLWSEDIPNANTIIVDTEKNRNQPLNTSETNDLKDSSSSKSKELLGGDNNILYQNTKDAIVLEESKAINPVGEKSFSNVEKHSDSYVNKGNASKNTNDLYKVRNNKTNLTPHYNQVKDPKEVLTQHNKIKKESIVDKNNLNDAVVSNTTIQKNFKNIEEDLSSPKDNKKEYLIKEKQLNASVRENGLVDSKVKSTDKKGFVEDRGTGLLNNNRSLNEPINTNKDIVAANEANGKEGENVIGKSLNKSVVDNNVIDTEKLDSTFKNQNSIEESAISENTTADSELSKEDKNESGEEKEVEEKESQTIEEAIAEQESTEETAEEKDDEESTGKKWQVRPNIAPVYYNSLSSGSPIDEQFKGNRKKGKVNMSYGVNVSYNLNKKLRVRTGVNKVELGYNTENVAVVPAAEGASIDFIKNVSMTSEATHLNIASADGFAVSQIPSSFRNLFDARISQKFGYIEVPLELSYKVSHKKLSIDLIAGMSTFFLDKNEVHAETNSFTTYLGEANNLNKTSFSTNFGVGFNYQISKAFHLNVEPTFKYQLNSFSNDSGNFRPYLLGVYSGFSFKF